MPGKIKSTDSVQLFRKSVMTLAEIVGDLDLGTDATGWWTRGTGALLRRAHVRPGLGASASAIAFGGLGAPGDKSAILALASRREALSFGFRRAMMAWASRSAVA